MKKLPVLITCLFLGVAMIAELPDAYAQEKEKSPDKASQKQLFETKCQRCHSLERIEKAHLNKDTAKQVVERMRKKAGSGISVADAETINTYLGDYFIIAPPAPAVPPTPIR
jgi:hypothetical protein